MGGQPKGWKKGVRKAITTRMRREDAMERRRRERKRLAWWTRNRPPGY